MLFNLANILVFIALGLGFILVTLTLGKLLRPSTPFENPDKLRIYECGELPITQAWFNFNPRFYIVAIVFLIFDVEVAFTYPVASVFKRWVAAGDGMVAFGELFVFVGILVLGLAYVWKKGDLEWVKRDTMGGVTRATKPILPDQPVVVERKVA